MIDLNQELSQLLDNFEANVLEDDDFEQAQECAEEWCYDRDVE